MRIAPSLGVARYRTAATFRSRRGGLITLVLLVALVGGLAMGSLAAARRTQASFSTYLASTNPSDLTITDFGGAQNGGGTIDVSPRGFQQVAQLPGVRHLAAILPIVAAPLRRDGSPVADNATLADALPLASLGLFFTQDRATVTQGRMANPKSQSEMMMTATAAQVLGFHLGQVVPWGIFSQVQEMTPGFGTAAVRPVRVVHAKLVGIIQTSTAVVQDDIDHYPTWVVFTPALGHWILAHQPGAVDAVTYGLQLRHGAAGASAVEAAFPGLLTPGTGYEFHATAPVVEKVDTSVKPIAIALWVFGGIATLAAILIALQVVGRQLQAAEADHETLRALGAPPAAIMADTLVGLLGAIALGALGAAVVAVALSPLAPLGPVRPVYPGVGVAFDWTVLGLGVLGLVLVLGSMAAALAYRRAPHRVARRQEGVPRTSRALAALAGNVPAPALVGMRFALEPGRGRTAVPVRSALLGSTLAIGLVVATLTFGSGLQTLVSHPSLYGWNWSYLLNPTNTIPPKATALLDHDRDVAAWAPYDYNDVEVDGQNVPMLFQRTGRPPISPPVVSGHSVEASNQIVLGAATMAALHTHLGSTVMVTFGSAKEAPYYLPPTAFVVVGTATLPAVGFASIVADHTSMGTGGLLNESALPRSLVDAAYNVDDGPELVFVRLRPGVSAAAGRANLETITRAADRDLAALPAGQGEGNTVSVLDVQHPAQIVNYRSIGSTPGILAGALVAGAVVALVLTLATSVRRRRRDLALLKTLGFTPRQLAGAIAWQASVIGVIGVVVGIPVGIALGRWLWTLFADLIYAVPRPTVPVTAVVLVGVGALIVANVLAALPGRSAARTSTATLLHTE